MGLNQVGVIGLGVMGSNLARNLLDNGVKTSVYDIDNDKVKRFMYTDGFTTLEEFIESLESPRTIILMVTAGPIIDEIIHSLMILLAKNDIIVDGGNSFYLDSIRRDKYLKDNGIDFISMGISGGSAGAREGASLMPSGEKSVVQKVLPIFELIAAKNKSGFRCVDYIGPSGSGHFIKMVHNGIEYADIQVICDAYAILKYGMKMTNSAIADVFSEWNHGILNSYLLDITIKILKTKDEFSKEDLIDKISDKAGSKGTGKWTVQYALDEGLPCGTLFAALNIRNLSKKEWDQNHSYTKMRLLYY